MKSFLVYSVLFLMISCSIDRDSISDPAIIYPIKEFAVANERTAWLITDRDELVRIVDQQADVVEFPGKPQTAFFLNENEGWVFASDSNLWATIDGGQNWSIRGSLSDIGPTISELTFTDNNNGWLINWFAILTTMDGGTTWNMVYPTDELSYGTLRAQPAALAAVTKDVAWIGMTNGVVLSTNDGGRAWQKFKLAEENPTIETVNANELGEVWAGAIYGNQGGLYYSPNSGKEWARILDEGKTGKLCQISLSFGALKDGWVFGSGCAKDPNDTNPIEGLAFRTKNGRDWTRMQGETFRIPFDEVKFTDPSNGWLLGYDHQERHSYIYRSTDSGENWNFVYEIKRPLEQKQ
jgi:photosystem II stability/assembly factor-like uncharacterized protein